MVPTRDNARTPVVLLHGFAQSGAAWNEVAQKLQASGHVTYAPDLASLNAPFTFEEVCSHVTKLLHTVAQTHGRPPLLVGYSMGGRIVLETLVRAMIARSLEQLPLAGVVVESAGLGPKDDGARIELEKRNRAWAHELRSAGIETFMDRWEALSLFASQRNLPEYVRVRVRAERMANDPQVLACMLENLGQHCQSYEGDVLTALACASRRGIPVCYVAGALDEKYVAVSRLVASAVPNVRVAVVPGAGHNVHLEKPEAFLDVICGCL